MSTTATFPSALNFDRAADSRPEAPSAGATTSLARLKGSFYRFLERLPERQQDVDRNFYRLPPMPF